MPRATLERKLQELFDEIMILGSMAQEAVQASTTALRRRDLEAAKAIIEGDERINHRRYQIEANCLVFIATQSPMASDLRTAAAILEVATDLERMADYGKGNARVSLMIGPRPLLSPLPELDEMTSLGCSLLRRALDAFVTYDADAASEIPAEDDRVDELYNQVYSKLIQLIIDDPSSVDEATNLLWVAHNLERFSDRVTNICERVVFTVTGEFLELDVEDEDLPEMADD
jgi:phosphate transport system protein